MGERDERDGKVGAREKRSAVQAVAGLLLWPLGMLANLVIAALGLVVSLATFALGLAVMFWPVLLVLWLWWLLSR